MAIFKVKCFRKCQDKFSMATQTQGALGFIHGTFFEVLVCVSISMGMLQYSDYLTDADWVSISL